ncbi:MAG: helix-turn-helix domain-containing protein [Clostridia bacterium]|nr:helix-turn-helix domain-containing protein [Clostridia bacterium]
MDVKKIGEFISKNRKLKGLTQEQLGEKLGVSNKTISRWENGNYMPDLSLLKPLSEELGISLNELLSGEKIEEENIAKNAEISLINTIDYTKGKIENEHKKISIVVMSIGIILSLIAFNLFESESSWGSIYSILGLIIFILGIFRFLKGKDLWKRIIISISLFVGIFGVFLISDYIGVVEFKRPPIYRYKTETSNIITYYNLLFNVYRINANTKNEYYIVDTKKEYNSDTVPTVPFNRERCGIDNIIKYQNKYMGNNSNIGNLISNLPLAENGYVIELDPDNLKLTINYSRTFWYDNEELYTEKSLIYNSVSIFGLIENVRYIKYNFSGSSYEVSRENIEKNYPNYSKIVQNGEVNKKEFNENLEKKMNDNNFIESISKIIFEK